ncbi:MAG: hypothetical protein NC217_02180 [Muribaculaceae bacterium]|nr:hypothetical protein [Muribaculaceae bacterium]
MAHQIYIFNPDTEMALATGRSSYTPPVPVARFAEQQILLPALYASPESAIIVPAHLHGHEHSLPYYEEAMARGMTLCTMESLPEGEIVPWGWNLALRQKFLRAGVSEDKLPTPQQLAKLRELAHRSLTMHFHEQTGSDKVPLYFTYADDAMSFVSKKCESGYVAKLPWSSSGRGVFFNPDRQTLNRLMSRQGGIMLEPLWDKALDFATEWYCRQGQVAFQGFSLFENSETGKYAGNLVAPQAELKRHILRYCDEAQLDDILLRLQQTIEQHIAPHYTGPLGIDMLCDKQGLINPCVEVNMRMTMGHVALLVYKYSGMPNNKPYYFRLRPFKSNLL